MRYVITGGSGYIGTRLVEILSEREDTERIVVCDIRPPAVYRPHVVYERLDVRDAQAAKRIFESERPDALIHLAFILNPMHDEHTMYDIDVNGTQNVLAAASSAGIGQVLVASSAVAYGAFPDNPVPLREEHPLRGNADFSYARDKTEADRLCQLWAHEHPDRIMTIVRPCIVFGPNVDNYLVRSWTKAPFVADIGAPDIPIQFVHEDDVVDGIARLVTGRHAGAYNVTGDGDMPLRESLAMIGVKRVRMPGSVFLALAKAFWALRLVEAPPGNRHFIFQPWICSNEKLKKTTGWKPRYSSRETFELTMRAHGKLPPAPASEEVRREAAREKAVA